jgi:hypothetical protein
MKRFFSMIVLSILTILILFGCSREQRPAELPELSPCTISITQDGKAMAGCSISLYPLDSDNKWSSGGMTNEDGIAKMRTHGKFIGVPVGKYKVVLQKQITEGETGGEPINGTPKEIEAHQERLKNNPPVTYNLVDTIFSDPEKTKLEINVLKKSENKFILDAGNSVRNIMEMP